MTRDEVEAAFNRHGPIVYRRARSILGNEEEAKDIVQEVFIKMLKGGPQRRGQTAAWLSRVTTNACLNRIRDTRRRSALREQHIQAPEPVSARPEDRILARALLAGAEERAGAAAICVHIDGMSHSEAAKVIGVSKRTVGALLARFARHAEAVLGRGEVDATSEPPSAPATLADAKRAS